MELNSKKFLKPGVATRVPDQKREDVGTSVKVIR